MEIEIEIRKGDCVLLCKDKAKEVWWRGAAEPKLLCAIENMEIVPFLKKFLCFQKMAGPFLFSESLSLKMFAHLLNTRWLNSRLEL